MGKYTDLLYLMDGAAPQRPCKEVPLVKVGWGRIQWLISTRDPQVGCGRGLVSRRDVRIERSGQSGSARGIPKEGECHRVPKDPEGNPKVEGSSW